MLGDKLGELVGTVTGVRVLPSGDSPHVETTFEINGDFSGVSTTWMGTYWAKIQPDGSLYGRMSTTGHRHDIQRRSRHMDRSRSRLVHRRWNRHSVSRCHLPPHCPSGSRPPGAHRADLRVGGRR